MTLENIVDIIAERDDLTIDEAIEIVNETKEMIDEALISGDYTEVEQIMLDQLGLEMDYIYAFID